MRQLLIVTAYINLLTLTLFDIRDPTCPFDSNGISSLSMNKVFRYISWIELLSLQFRCFILNISCFLIFLVKVHKVMIHQRANRFVERIRYLNLRGRFFYWHRNLWQTLGTLFSLSLFDGLRICWLCDSYVWFIIFLFLNSLLFVFALIRCLRMRGLIHSVIILF